jgi:hypothetical protein
MMPRKISINYFYIEIKQTSAGKICSNNPTEAYWFIGSLPTLANETESFWGDLLSANFGTLDL